MQNSYVPDNSIIIVVISSHIVSGSRGRTPLADIDATVVHQFFGDKVNAATANPQFTAVRPSAVSFVSLHLSN